ncbi:hypothetical protein ABJB31_06405 [Bifidobacterium bifidum]|uniref:hypothetical protein n=1 Tax=Bifidobacterium bifidum TaxID=1681 RepID=UPI0006CB617D|nr:hypothetical protein [Bifidobacterium bifidum]ALE11232.1 Hypothetical protein RY70_870 [Bifidobacterium bifidum]MDK7286222.1 hypothetical protein [Bifidobacterium bifidum]
MIFINIMLSCIATTVMATALTTALPPITKDLGVSMQTGSGSPAVIHWPWAHARRR